MPDFYALVDAMAGREPEVEKGLAGLSGVRFVRVKERAHDFLIRFSASGFDKVDDFLQTHVRPLHGVMGVEIIQDADWDDLSAQTRQARQKLA